MLERRHCHPLYIVESIFNAIAPMAVYVLIAFGSALSGAEPGDDTGELYLIIAGVVVGLLAIVGLFAWLRWRSIWVSAEDNTLIFESGIFFKRRVTIPFSKINTIDMGRNLFQRIFGTCRLKVDTGAISDGSEKSAEMNLVFSLAQAEEFRSYILNREAQDDQVLRENSATMINAATEPHWAVQARFSDFFLYGLTSSSVMRLFMSLIVVIGFIGEISAGLLEQAGDAVMPFVSLIYSFISANGLVVMLLYLILIAAILAVLANIVSIITSAIRFYGFRVAREGANIIVRYGLISVKNYTVPAQNVHSVVIKQNLLQQIIGRCSVEMISIGYGDEKQETALLFPIISVKKLDWLLGSVLPEYSRPAVAEKAHRRSFRFLVLRPILWGALFLGGTVYGCSFIMDSVALVGIVAAFIMLYIIVNSILSYFQNAIGGDERVVMVRSGGARRRTNLIRLDAVQSIAETTGVFQRRHNVASYRVDFHAPMLRSIAAVSHLDAGLMNTALKLGDISDISE